MNGGGKEKKSFDTFLIFTLLENNDLVVRLKKRAREKRGEREGKQIGLLAER